MVPNVTKNELKMEAKRITKGKLMRNKSHKGLTISGGTEAGKGRTKQEQRGEEMTKKRPEQRDGRAKGEQGKGRESKKIDSDRSIQAQT